MSESRRRWEPFAIGAILLLALALRCYRLGYQSFWNDEGTAVALAQRPLGTILLNASNDIHPPLYYLLLHYWLLLAGTSEFGARAFSALCGVAVVAMTYVLARRTTLPGTSSPTVAALAALLAAVSPLMIYYSQEARMYILVALLGTLSMYAFHQLLHTPRERGRWPFNLAWTAAYLVATGAAVYTHYFAFTLLAAQNVVFALGLLLCWRRRAAPDRYGAWLLCWATLQVVIVAAYVPWLVLSWSAMSDWPAVSQPFSLGTLLAQVGRAFAFGLTVEDRVRFRVLGLVLLLLTLPGLLPTRPAGQSAQKAIQRPSAKPSGMELVFLACYLLIPLLCMYVLSLQRPMYKPKFLLLALPPYHLLLAHSADWLGRGFARLTRVRWTGVLLTSLLVLGLCAPAAYALPALYGDSRYFRDDYRGIVQYIEAVAGPQDAILINAPSQIETVDYYYDGPLPLYPLPLQRPLDQERTEASLEQIVADHSRIYGIFWATDESDPQRFIENWLDQHCFKALDSWFGSLRLVVYAVPQAVPQTREHSLDYTLGDEIRLAGYTLLTPTVRSGDIVQVTLYWEALEQPQGRYKVFLHLVDAQGNIVGQRDAEPGGGVRLTNEWQAGEQVIDNYGVPIQPGTPPGELQLRVGMYALDGGQRLSISQDGQAVGDAVDLATITVERPLSPPPTGILDLQTRTQAQWGALELLGYRLQRLGREDTAGAALPAGQPLELILFWRKTGSATAPEQMLLSLQDRRGQTVWQTVLPVVGDTYPPGDWEEGEVVRDPHPFALPAELAAGSYRVQLQPLAEDEARPCELGRLVVTH